MRHRRLLAGLTALGLAMAANPVALEAQTRMGPAERVAEALAVVETWLEAERAYDRIPAVSAAIVHDQELVWSGAYGAAHPARGIAATPRTLYSICSISKLFTSIAVMQLRDRGLLALSDPVAEHLPWYDVRPSDPQSPPVTVEALLTHAAGLPRESDHPYWSAPDFVFPTREQVIERLGEQESLYPAWKYFQYSNLGLTLAGELVRERSGVPYDEYVRRNILDPLGLHDTHPDMPAHERGRRLATGYGAPTRSGDREEMPFFQARGISPAAGFASTVEDLARFASWQFRLDAHDPEVLHPHTLREMQRVHFVDPGWNTFWGLGFAIMRDDGRTFVGHGGSCPGYRSQLLLRMDDEIATVFMANASGVDTRKYALGMYDLVSPALLAAAVDEPAEADTQTADRVAERTSPPLADYLGSYSVQPWGGEVAVVRWRGGLALLPLPTDDPVDALTRLEHVEGDTFRRVRNDDALGEPITFERDADGRVVRFRRFENFYPRIR